MGALLTRRRWHVAAVGRPYPKAIGGTPTGLSWDGTTLTLGFEGRNGVAKRHDIFFPSATPAIACDGKPVANIFK